MIYSFLKKLVRLTSHSYFRYVKVKGKDLIPSDKPIIFVANHPSAFMDPIVIATELDQQLHFIAAGEFIGKGIQAKFMQKYLHMIPVYRPNTMPGQAHKNDEMFQKCYEHLKNRGSILIFPEGNSVTEKRLRSIKTGVARIAIGAEKIYDKQLDVHIIPIGLNYSDPHEFRSDLYMKIMSPIRVLEFMKNDLDEKEQVREITHEVEQQMQASILHLQDEKLDSIMNKVEAIYELDLKERLNLKRSDLEEGFELQKDMIAAIEYYEENKDPEIQKMEGLIDEYHNDLKKHQLEDQTVFKSGQSYSKAIHFIGIPLFIIGFLINIVPYTISRIAANKINKTFSFFGSMLMAIGMVVFILWYVGWGIFIYSKFQPRLFGILFPFVAYFSGIFSLYYMSNAARMKQAQRFKAMKNNKSDHLEKLVSRRNKIVAILEQKKEDFLVATEIN